MSYQNALDTLCLKATPRVAHTEYNDHEMLTRAVEAQGAPFNDAWQLDLLWNTCDGPRAWAESGRATDMGHAVFNEGGGDYRLPQECPFKTVDEVYAFDAVAEYGLPHLDDLSDFYERQYRALQEANPGQLLTGGYYKTIVSGAIEAFGWEMLLQAAADPVRFEAVLETIFQLSLHHYRAWAQTSIPVFICHDDMVWSTGPFMRAAFYRRAIFPRYRQLWEVLHAAGKKVLYCSDGNWGMFVDDIAAAGADGFIFEPMTALEPVAEKYGQTHVIVSSKVDCRTLTFADPAAIQAEIDATLPIAKACPGFIFAVGNHIASNVPLENALFYYEYLSERWSR
jgi:hypothetical protein